MFPHHSQEETNLFFFTLPIYISLFSFVISLAMDYFIKKTHLYTLQALLFSFASCIRLLLHFLQHGSCDIQ
ncbi:uncharacterized protein EV154DRAFT_504419 [Mucor mucedo]|uniref:uncharacterized protein n=1 Tax=Mucor mucedo TaxID=29922 RepID=UPI00221FC8CE|nr:uncharacterized protein EV154DRAFT_504419 [Mucor mucedo]KAI7892663.1 hypothetical protein EV154DRAFT_504419 [Mucor mucedo]